MKSFGVAARENHDSRPFYSRKLFPVGQESTVQKSREERIVPAEILDKVYHQDSRSLPMLPDNSTHLMVTSPPYNVGKEYDQNLTMSAYLELLKDVFRECMRVLVPGGRACINLANLGRKPYIPLHSHVIQIMERLGFLMRGEIIWDKSASAGTSTAWGSWKSAANPTLRDVHEYILVFCKESFGRERGKKKNTIDERQFLNFTKSVWSFPAESARRVSHPAPFPVELPLRLIHLYTFEGDVILDPFAGSGTTGIAALQSRRHFVLCDTEEQYVLNARERISKHTESTGEGEMSARKRARSRRS